MLSISRVKELIKDKNISDDEAEKIRDNMYELASIIFGVWQEDRKKKDLQKMFINALKEFKEKQ